MSNPNVRAALSFDPLAEAEKFTGKSYKEDAETMRLGFALAMEHNQRKESLLTSAHDSHMNMNFADSLALFADLGFSEVYRETFAGRDTAEVYVILWHADGILADCESYGATRRNSAKVYYNYRFHDGTRPRWDLTSSGGMTGDVWVGYHDAREGIRHNLNALRAEGAFLPTWVERPFLWLLNYGEKSTDDYKDINAHKIALLPEHVRAAITPEVTA